MEFGGGKKVNMQRKRGVKGGIEGALFAQRYSKLELLIILFSCVRERKTTTAYSEIKSANQQSPISDKF